MGLFSRKAASPVKVEAAAGYGGAAVSSSVTSTLVGTGRDRAMEIPAISRSRDILCSLVGGLPIKKAATQWNGETLEEIPVLPDRWMTQPDPNCSRSHIMAWTADDLLFYGRAYWLITSRYSTGYPASFQRMPFKWSSLVAPLFDGNLPILPPTAFYFNGQQIALEDVVVFYSPQTPVYLNGRRTVETARRLEEAALRFASTPTSFGYLKQTGGEQLTAQELSEIAAAWSASRTSDGAVVGALNEYIDWHESTMDPSRLQLVEARNYQALECARLMNVPPYLIGAPTGTGMTYQNAVQAVSDAAGPFGAGWLIDVIEQTLSSEQVTPRGTVVRLDRSAWSTPAPTSAPLTEPAPEGATA